jgi:hypothetical protein
MHWPCKWPCNRSGHCRSIPLPRRTAPPEGPARAALPWRRTTGKMDSIVKRVAAAALLLARLGVAGCARRGDSVSAPRTAPPPRRPTASLMLRGELIPPDPDHDRTFSGWGRVRMVAGGDVRLARFYRGWTFSVPNAPQSDLVLVVEGRQQSQLSGSNQYLSFVGVRHLKTSDLGKQPVVIPTRRPWLFGVAVSCAGTTATGSALRSAVRVGLGDDDQGLMHRGTVALCGPSATLDCGSREPATNGRLRRVSRLLGRYTESTVRGRTSTEASAPTLLSYNVHINVPLQRVAHGAEVLQPEA